MNKIKNNLYILALFIIASIIYVSFYQVHGHDLDWTHVLFWCVLAVVSETFNITLPSGAATSVGMAIYLAALVIDGPFVAVTVPIMGFLFRAPESDGERIHILKTPLSITVYNISSHVIFIGVISYIYSMFGFGKDDYAKIIPISLGLLAISELLSILFVSLYLFTKDGKSEIPLFRSFIGALPSTWAVGALGLFLAFAAEKFGLEIVALFFVPLLLTRYSFKLYFDSQKMGMETIQALNETLLVRDQYTGQHTERVEEYSVMMAKALNYKGASMDRLRKAARLHDVGKIGIPDGILNKPGKLTNEEYEQIKDHAAMGAQILGNVDALKKIAEVVRSHHERPDGKGYPDGLTGEKIPRDSAILSIADTYDAMTSDRPYRKALTKDQAVEELIKYKGTQFNSYLVDVFVANIDAHEAEKELNAEAEIAEQKDNVEFLMNDQDVEDNTEENTDKATEVSA